MKNNIHFWKRGVKKANIAAAVLIILLIVLSIGVLIYNPFIPDEVHADYGSVFTEVRAGIERAYFDSFQTSLRTGLLVHGGVWYYNQPYRINADEVENILQELVEETVLNVQYDGGSASIVLSEIEGNMDLSLEADGFRITLDGAFIDVAVDDEQRIIDLSDDYMIPSNLRSTIDSLNTWLGCDAGGLTELFLAYHESEVCQFSNCCCGREPINMSEIEKIIELHGISRQDITMILDESVDVLNNLLSGASSCGEVVPLRNDFKCFVSYDRSIIEFGNDYNLLIKEDKVCADSKGATVEHDDCSLHPSPYDGRVFSEWIDPENVDFSGSSDLDSDALIFSSRLAPDTQTEDLNQDLPDPDNDPRALYELGLERKAAGDVTIICRNPDLSVSDYQELRFRIKFRNKYVCDPPDDEPDWDNTDQVPIMCAGGSQVLPVVCPVPTPIAVPCNPDDREHHLHCPIDIICIVDTPDFTVDDQGLFDCLDYIDSGLPWHYPGADDRCEGDFNVCALCGDQAMCDVPVERGTGCSTREYPSGRINQCIDLRCSGDVVGEEACILEFPNDARCGSGTCRGTCDASTGQCIYHTNGNSCIRNFGGCSVEGTCSNGACVATHPGTDCCAGSFCPSSRPYCCGGAYCSSDPTCPVPS